MTCRKYRSSNVIIGAVTLLLMMTPALACPVCFSAEEESRTAFLLTTGFLSVMPWLIVGGGILWYKRRLRELESGEL